jgi:predicted small secreted protein
MKLSNHINASLVIAVVLVALSACQKPEGPAERAGKQIDQTVDKAGQQIEKAGDKIQDAAKSDKPDKK